MGMKKHRCEAAHRMLTKWADCQSVEKARKQGNFASGKIYRQWRLASLWACNLATGFDDPEGLGKSTCRKQKSPLIFYISERFLRLWALSALWRHDGIFNSIVAVAKRLGILQDSNLQIQMQEVFSEGEGGNSKAGSATPSKQKHSI